MQKMCAEMRVIMAIAANSVMSREQKGVRISTGPVSYTHLILVVINPSAKEVTFEFDAKPGETIYSFGGSVESDGKTVKASGQTAAFIKLA